MSHRRQNHLAAMLVAVAMGLIFVLPATARTHTRMSSPLCSPTHSRIIAADLQAQVYAVRFEKSNEWEYRACAYGHRGSTEVGAAPSGCNWNACRAMMRFALVGAMVAYEEQIVPIGRDEQPGNFDGEWYIEVRNLQTGKLIHRTPTGTPLRPKRHYIGVGNIISMVLKPDGSAAWIAEDFERSGSAKPITTYLDIGAVDKSGTRLLASGTTIDPSSLSLSVGSVGNTYAPDTTGHTVFWSEGGQSRSASLR